MKLEVSAEVSHSRRRLAKSEQEDEAVQSFRVASGSSHSGMAEITFTPEQRDGIPGVVRDVEVFLTMLNDTARDHGFPPTGKLLVDESHQSKSPSEILRNSPRKWYRNKAEPTPSSRISDSRSREPHITRKNSLSSLLSLHQRPPPCNSLEDIYRLSGTGTFELPAELQPVNLIVPLGMAAAANFLVHNSAFVLEQYACFVLCLLTTYEAGLRISGVFRVPGKSSVVTALKQHYDTPIQADKGDKDHVCMTVASPNLPFHIPATVHDVGSLYKKLLAETPGGVLGSMSLFMALEKIRTAPRMDLLPFPADLDFVKYRLAALTLLSIKSHHRLAVICSVFGLLSHLKSDADAGEDSCQKTRAQIRQDSEAMTAQSLAIIFGPLLIGSLTDEILVDHHDFGDARSVKSNTHSLSLRRALFRPLRRATNGSKSNESKKHQAFATKVAQTKMAIDLCEYLIKSWRWIAGQMKQVQPYSPASSFVRTRSVGGVAHQSSQLRRCRHRSMPLLDGRGQNHEAMNTNSEPSHEDKRNDSTILNTRSPLASNPVDMAQVNDARVDAAAASNIDFNPINVAATTAAVAVIDTTTTTAATATIPASPERGEAIRGNDSPDEEVMSPFWGLARVVTIARVSL